MAHFKVIVSNIGTVYQGPEFSDADTEFDFYVECSCEGIRRAAGEQVSLFKDGRLIQEFEPS